MFRRKLVDVEPDEEWDPNKKHFLEELKRSNWEKAGSVANTAGYMIGLASTAKEVYTAARPVLQGAGLLI